MFLRVPHVPASHESAVPGDAFVWALPVLDLPKLPGQPLGNPAYPL
ncbi:MAG: hypothetical protein ACOYOS_18045 [Syntrophales bacterium]